MAGKADAKNTQLINDTAKYLSDMKSGDIEAFDKLYSLTNQYVQWAVRMHLSNQNDWEDVVQEVYLTVYNKCAQLNDTTTGLKWIKTIAFNKATDRNRRTYRVNVGNLEDSYDEIEDFDSVVNDDVLLPEDIMINQESRDIVRQVIHDLKDVQRDSIICYYYNNMKTKEIAETMDIPEGTVKTALSRGRNEIKKKLTDYEKSGYFKLLAVPAAVTFFAFMHADAETQAAELSDVQKFLHRTAEDIVKIRGSEGILGLADTAAKTATTGSIISIKAIIPIIIAAVATVAIGFGVHAHNNPNKEMPPAIQEESTPAAEPNTSELSTTSLSQEELYNLYLHELIKIQGENSGQEFYTESDVITSDLSKGVVFAKLIDFNQDKINELIVVYSDGFSSDQKNSNRYHLDIFAQDKDQINNVYHGDPFIEGDIVSVNLWKENNDILLLSGDMPTNDNWGRGCELWEYRFDGTDFKEAHYYHCGYPDGYNNSISESEAESSIDGVVMNFDEVDRACYEHLGMSDPENENAIAYGIVTGNYESTLGGTWVYLIDQLSISQLQKTLSELGYQYGMIENSEKSSTSISDDSSDISYDKDVANNSSQITPKDENVLDDKIKRINGVWAEIQNAASPNLFVFDCEAGVVDVYCSDVALTKDGYTQVSYSDPVKVDIILKRCIINPFEIIDINAGESISLPQSGSDRNYTGTAIYLSETEGGYWLPDELSPEEKQEGFVIMSEWDNDGNTYTGSSLVKMDSDDVEQIILDFENGIY